jgi:SAM-dependent methyltransferase
MKDESEYWNRRWQERRELLDKADAGECARLWADPEAARRYAGDQEDDPGGRIAMILEDLGPVSGYRILDIGSGPGSLSLPLAARGADICAVEPAEGMRQVFKEQAEAKGICRYRIIPRRWEEASLEALGEPYDLVLAAFSLGIWDLKAALEKMHSIARGRVFIYWFSGESSWQRTKRELWPLLHGQELPLPPEEDLLGKLIKSLGYDLVQKPFQYRRRRYYESLADLAAQQRISYKLDRPELEARFLRAFEPLLRRDQDRYWVEEWADFFSYSWPGGAA